MLTLPLTIAFEILRLTLQASPFVLLGLLAAGVIHVLVPERVVLRWMGGRGLSGAARAAAIGVPLPVCSCGVVPLAVELERKGASRPATVSFLVTTPESSLDSILLTWGLMGPVMAIARPIAAVGTAMLGAVFSILSRDQGRATASPSPSAGAACAHHPPSEGADHDHGACDDDHSTLTSAAGDEARAAVSASWKRLWRRPVDPDAPRLRRSFIRPALDYGFRSLLDDLAFWLAAGLILGGVLGAILPDDLAAIGLGGGILPLLLMLVIGVPLYTCASAATPVAAVMVAKGLSPGAALVFLLAGPATSVATMMLLASHFGRRFVAFYVAAVAIGALAAGLALDALVDAEKIRAASLGAATNAGASWLEWLCALLLVTLLAWRLTRGAWRRGWGELVAMTRLPLTALRLRFPRVPLRGLGGLLAAAAAAIWLASGLVVVDADSRGYGFVFGRLTRDGLGPGLHWLPPAPIGRFEARRVSYARKADVGYRTDLALLSRRRDLSRVADRNAWHSPVAAMNSNPQQGTYLTGDENLVEIAFTVHYGLTDPKAFFYGLDHQVDVVNLYAEAVAREIIAQTKLDDVLTVQRSALEERITAQLDARLEAIGLGTKVRAVQIVDVHPPSDAVFAFRDVSSAREERETAIHRARGLLAWEVPLARGEANRRVQGAAAAAEAQATRAAGESEGFLERARVVAADRQLLRHLLSLESAERQLAGRSVVVAPAGADLGSIELWRSLPAAPDPPTPTPSTANPKETP